MKLAIVTETFPPEINGVAMTLGRLATLLAEKGIEVSIIAPQRPERLPSADHLFSLFSVPGFPLPKYPELRFGWPAFQQLRREWTRRPPTLVHVATEGPLGWSAATVARQLDIPLVSSFHTNFHSYSRHYGLGLLQTVALAWLRTFHNKTLRTFVPSHDLMDTLQEKGFHHLRLLGRGVDTIAFDPAHRSESLRAQWGATPDTPVILYTGRLAEEKNLPLLVKAYLRVQNKLPEAKMVFVGDGPLLGKLRELLPMAIFTGMKTGSALAASYASADLFLFASTTETFGNVVTEAMASGLPVLAFDYAAPGRFIQPHLNGLLAPLDDETAFLEKADWLALYPSKWNAMGLAARSTVLPLSWNAIADRYLNEISTLALN